MLNIYFLSNYSIEFIFDSFRKKLNDFQIESNIIYPGFNQYSQQIFNPESELYSKSPEIVFISIDLNNYFANNFDLKNNPPITDNVSNQIEQVFQSFEIISEKLKNSTIFIDNFYLDSTFNFGTLEYNFFYLEELISKLNSKLIEIQQRHHNVKIIDINALINKYGQKELFDYRLLYLAKFKWNKKGIDKLSDLYISHIKSYLGIRKKCVVVDLDNTLWGGIIGQDGIENIKLSNDGIGKAFYDFQSYLLKLYNQGILLAICSKNSENVVNEVFEKHPYMILKPEHFAVKKINWNNKVENIIEIAKELNIGLDSLVFLDDSKFERELIKQQLPQVEVPDLPDDPSLYTIFISELDYFNFHKLTDDDFKRNESYRLNFERKKEEKSFSNIKDYLRSLNMKVEIRKIDDFTFPRIVQLIQKTNQFNTTTKRYTESDIMQMRNSDEWEIYSFSVSDKFGDNGIVGVFILKFYDESSQLNIDSFIMSCRVIGREIENAVLYFIVNTAKEKNIKRLTADIIPTPKNEPCRNVYKNYGFEEVKENSWALDITKKDFELPDYFQLISL